MARFAILVHGLLGGWADTFALLRSLRKVRLYKGNDHANPKNNNVWLWAYPSHLHSFRELSRLFDKDIALHTPIMQHLTGAEGSRERLEIDFITHSMGCMTLRSILSSRCSPSGATDAKGEEDQVVVEESSFLQALLQRSGGSGGNEVYIRIVNIAPMNRGSELARYLLDHNPLHGHMLKRVASSAEFHHSTSALWEMHHCAPQYFEEHYLIHKTLLESGASGERENNVHLEMHDIIVHTDLPGLRLPRFITHEKNDGVLTISDQRPVQRHAPYTHVHRVNGQHVSVLWSKKVRKLLWNILGNE